MAAFLRIIASAFGLIAAGFGINALLNPRSAVSFFESDYPTAVSPNKNLVDILLAVYGVRNIFNGIVIIAAAKFGSKKLLGIIILALGAVAGADGYICKTIVGHGEWGHWGFVPFGVVVGLALMVV